MYQVPAQPKIYHILHIDRLASVLAATGLWSDAAMQQQGIAGTTIGMTQIKQRRLSLPVKCHSGLHVGDCVPFYFCPRSIMLYLIHKANHADLAYRGGQRPIVHLQADLFATLDWAHTQGIQWAFSLSNAGARYTEFRARRDLLSEVNWPAVRTTDFRSPDMSEGKQAEFLVSGFFPWHLIEQIGVYSIQIQEQATRILQAAAHQPAIIYTPDWYY